MNSPSNSLPSLTCERCRGSGYVICQRCGGRGLLSALDGRPFGTLGSVDCSTCGGEGRWPCTCPASKKQAAPGTASPMVGAVPSRTSAPTLGSTTVGVRTTHTSTGPEQAPATSTPPSSRVTVCPTTPGAFRTVSAALAAVAPSGTIIVRPGHYTESLDVNRAVTIQGDGPAKQIVIESVGRACVQIAATGVTLRGLCLRALPSPNAAKVHTVTVSHGIAVLESCHVSTAAEKACVAASGVQSRLELRTCTVQSGPRSGILASEYASITLTDCTIADFGESSVVARRHAVVIAHRCHIRGGAKHAAHAYKHGAIQFDKCVLAAPSVVAVMVKEQARGLLTDCVIERSPYGGVVVDSASALNLSGSNLRTVGTTGLAVSSTAQATVTRCTIDGIEGNAVHVRDMASLRLEQCRITNSRQAAVRLDDSSRGKLVDVIIRANYAGLIARQQAQAELRGVRFTEQNQRAVDCTTETRVVLDTCVIADNDVPGIFGSAPAVTLRTTLLDGTMVGAPGPVSTGGAHGGDQPTVASNRVSPAKEQLPSVRPLAPKMDVHLTTSHATTAQPAQPVSVPGAPVVLASPAPGRAQTAPARVDSVNRRFTQAATSTISDARSAAASIDVKVPATLFHPTIRQRVCAVVFDLDGTLVDTVPVMVETLAALGAAAHITLDRDALASYCALGYPHFLAPLGLQNASMRYWRMYDSKLRGVKPFPGVGELLEHLRSTEIRVAVVTTLPSVKARAVLDAAGLGSFFEAEQIIGYHDAPIKPRPDGILLALSRLAIAPSNAAYIGDSRIDMQAARAAGCLAVGATWGPNAPTDVVAAGADVTLPDAATFGTWLAESGRVDDIRIVSNLVVDTTALSTGGASAVGWQPFVNVLRAPRMACVACGEAVVGETVCRSCRDLPQESRRAVDRVTCGWTATGDDPLSHALYGLKGRMGARARPELALPLGRVFLELAVARARGCGIADLFRGDGPVIVPVPSSQQGLEERGFDHLQLMLKALCAPLLRPHWLNLDPDHRVAHNSAGGPSAGQALLDLDWIEAVATVNRSASGWRILDGLENTDPGSQKGRGASERAEAAAAHYRLRPGWERVFRGKQVFLVDDLITTGTGMRAWAAILKAAGANHVHMVALARWDSIIYDQAPLCPSCGHGKLQLKRNSYTGNAFWGCSRWRSGCAFKCNRDDLATAIEREQASARVRP